MLRWRLQSDTASSAVRSRIFDIKIYYYDNEIYGANIANVIISFIRLRPIDAQSSLYLPLFGLS